tara:strand:+ start:5177 stop:6313 length:1137 start_codon:yes stop_codon:yes gene_type:complete
LIKVEKIKSYKFSSKYGNNKVFGQPKAVRSLVIVEIKLSNGIRGYGESYQSAYVPEIVDFIIKEISENFEKISINSAIKNIKNFRIPFVSQNGVFKSTLSSIEIALIDAKSKSLGLTFYKYLNKFSLKKKVPTYASGGSVIFNKKHLDKDLQNIKKNGFVNYKMRIGYLSFKKDIERINFVIKNLKKKSLMIDAIMGTLNKWKLNEAKKRVKYLNKYKLLWLEEPLPAERMHDYKILKKLSKNPVAIGESFTNFYEFENIIKNDLCDIVQPDITQVGIFDAIKIVKLAKKYKKKVALHVWGSPISLMSNLHFALAYKEVDIIEFPLVSLEFLKKNIDKKIEVKDGFIKLKKKELGLGIDLRKENLKSFNFKKKSGFKI